MTKIDALVSIAQTVLRLQHIKGWVGPVTLSEISQEVSNCASLVAADRSEINAAVMELARRYNLRVPV